MVSMQDVRTHNASVKELGPGLVPILARGTDGISLSTARAFVRQALSPRVYLIGRNESKASQVITEFEGLNPGAKTIFLQGNISLLRDVDTVCESIKEQEPNKINLLFMRQGIWGIGGIDETAEGLDMKLSLHYYSRMRFVYNLLPQLTAAFRGNNLSRVVTVLGTGNEGPLYLDDLSLKTHYSFTNYFRHTFTMSSLAVSHLAASHPQTTFIHSFPSVVKRTLCETSTPLIKGLVLGLFSSVLSAWTVPLEESGERHLYAARSDAYPPVGRQGPVGVYTATGADGVTGSRAYLLHWDGSTPNKKVKLLREYQLSGVEDQVWEHTLEVFDKVCGQPDGKY